MEAQMTFIVISLQKNLIPYWLIARNQKLNLVIKKLKKVFLKKGFLVLNQFSIHGASSAHYSSNLFNSYNIKINNKAEFKKNLHICDSSTFGHASSSQPHTFFIMSNSYRLANNALQI